MSAAQQALTKSLKQVELTTDVFGYYIKDTGEHIPIKRFTWKNTQRIQVQVITYGASIISIKYPSKKGLLDDVVLGFDDMSGYMENREQTFGTVGRFSNLIKDGRFSIGKHDYQLTKNFGGNHYNGGDKGFDKSIWDYSINGCKVVLSLFSPDGQEGYPGDMIVFATFELTANNEFKVEYRAVSTKTTIANITNHFYFNLAGHAAGPCEIKKHQILLNCDCHTVSDEDMIPTGEIKSVQNTIYDFQIPVMLNKLLDKLDGYNSNFCVNKGVEQSTCTFVSRITHVPSGRVLEIYSNQPGVQFETANTFPLSIEQDPLNAKSSPYFKNDIVTFDLLDEIYVRVIEAANVDKTNSYMELLNVVRDLQKKSKQVYRKPSSLNSVLRPTSFVKRSTASLFDDLTGPSLTNLQKRYLDKIHEYISKIAEPNSLTDLKNKIEKAIAQYSQLNDTDDKQHKLLRGKKGARYFKHGSICMQTQSYPDSVNHPTFPSVLLKPSNTYHHVIVYKFWLKGDQLGVSGFL